MRNQLLTGYLIHYRKYREKSYIIHMFSKEYGRINGILRQSPPPQYQPIRLYASGKHELKNFSQMELSHQPIFLTGDAFFLGFYLNELLFKLAPLEQELAMTFMQYQQTIQRLCVLKASENPEQEIRQILRQFEHVLLQDLGYLLDFYDDHEHRKIQENQTYQFDFNEGFVMSSSSQAFLGKYVISMQSYVGGDFSATQLHFLGKLYRQMIHYLLGERPLKSRQLWIQHKVK